MIIEGANTSVTVGWLKRQLWAFPDDKVVEFSTVCFNPGEIPEIIKNVFISCRDVNDDSPVIFDLCTSDLPNDIK